MTARRTKGEGSVYRRADGRWVASLNLGYALDGKRKRATIYARTRPEALEKLRVARNQLLDLGEVSPTASTVTTWLRLWLDEIAPEDVRATTLPGYRSKVERYLIPAIGRHRLDRLAPEHLRAMYRDMRGRGLAEATLRQTHAILARALVVAVREGRVTRNVAKLVSAPGTETASSEPLNPTEIAAILTAVAGDRLESRWLAALVLGLRQGEALGLGWDQVDLDAGTLSVTRALARIPGRGLVMVPPKTKKSVRTIPLPDLVWASLQRRRADYEAERVSDGYADLGLVWAAPATRRKPAGGPRDPSADHADWSALLARAEVSHRRLHDARHAAASTLAEIGVPVEVRMAILGHTQVSVAMGYTHTTGAAMREAMALVDRAHRAIEA